MEKVKSVNAVKARKNFGELIEEVYYRGDQFVLERSGRPMAAMVPLPVLDQWKKQRLEDMKVFDEIWASNPAVEASELTKAVNKTITQSRQARQKKARHGASGTRF